MGPGFETPPVAGCIGTDDVNFSSKNLQWDGDEWAYALSPLRAKICGVCHVAEGTAGGGHHFTEKSVAQTRGSGFGCSQKTVNHTNCSHSKHMTPNHHLTWGLLPLSALKVVLHI